MWKERLNAALNRATGHELRRVRGASGPAPVRGPRPGDRLLEAPAFVLSSVRSGSTLVRVLLNSHSQIHSPGEIHLRSMTVTLEDKYAERSVAELGLEARSLEYLLWDRVLDRELQASGKRLLVKKTPSDVFIADRLRECWPDARFIFLLRHPGAIARSRQALRPQDSPERNAEMVLKYCTALEQARRAYDGLEIRYEQVAADPATATQEICRFLGVPWEEQMLDYGRFDHGRYKAGLGDWKEKIQSGKVQAPEPPPTAAETPAVLHEIAAAWGYLPAVTPAAP